MSKILSELTFNEANVLIVGDLMLDKYYYGNVSRISPEAPVPVINVKSESSTMGGAGNVVNNIKGLTSNCTVICAAQNDDAGILLTKMFNNINAQYKFIDAGMPTISKLRVIGSKQQIARLDFENIIDFSSNIKESIKEIYKKELENHDIVVISDYGKGMCSEEVCSYVIQEANLQNKKVIIDPKGSNWNKYSNAFIVTPNVKELSEVCGYEISNTDDYIIKHGTIKRKI